MPGTIPRPFDVKGQGPPNVGADIIDALVWQSQAYGGTTDLLAIGAGARGGGLLWNPPASGASALVYGMQMAASANANVRLGLVNALPTGYTTTGTQTQAKHLQSSGSAIRTSVCLVYANAAAPALPAFLKAYLLAANQTFQAFSGMFNIVLRPGTGVAIVVDGPAVGYTVAATWDWAEYSVT